MPEAIVGFSAIQLNHDLGGLDLSALNDSARIEPTLSLDDALIPGDAIEQEALGYLHANCGHCHGGFAPTAGMALWVDVGIAEVEDTATFRTTVGVESVWRPDVVRISRGEPDVSAIVQRMSARDFGVDQMPPIGTEVLHDAGVANVIRWIETL